MGVVMPTDRPSQPPEGEAHDSGGKWSHRTVRSQRGRAIDAPRAYERELEWENERRNDSLAETPDSVPVTIYVRRDVDYLRIEMAVRACLQSLGAEIVYKGNGVRGSIWRALGAKLRKTTEENAHTGFVMAGRVAELYGVDQKQAEVDKLNAEAFSKVMSALEDTPAAAIQMGSVLLVKNEHGVIRRELSQLEIAHLRRNPILTSRPETILKELQELNESTDRLEEEPNRTALEARSGRLDEMSQATQDTDVPDIARSAEDGAT